jgi:hypothetical protein
MPHRARWPLFSLIVLQGLQLLSLIPWLVIAGLSVMAFDAPGSTQRWEPWLFVAGVWSYPVWLLLAGIGSWLLYLKQFNRSAVILSAVFTLPMLAFGVLLLAAR